MPRSSACCACDRGGAALGVAAIHSREHGAAHGTEALGVQLEME